MTTPEERRDLYHNLQKLASSSYGWNPANPGEKEWIRSYNENDTPLIQEVTRNEWQVIKNMRE